MMTILATPEEKKDQVYKQIIAIHDVKDIPFENMDKTFIPPSYRARYWTFIEVLLIIFMLCIQLYYTI